MIEVEKKAFLSESQYQSIQTLLIEQGFSDLGANDTETIFYLGDEYQVKVQHSVSKGTAKIAWKSGSMRDGAAARQEIELPFLPNAMEQAEQLVAAMVPEAAVFRTRQLRHDYQRQDLSVAVKFSDDWGHHLEIDTVVSDEGETPEADRQIQALAEALGVTLLSEAEEKAFVESKLAKRS